MHDIDNPITTAAARGRGLLHWAGLTAAAGANCGAAGRRRTARAAATALPPYPASTARLGSSARATRPLYWKLWGTNRVPAEPPLLASAG